MRIIPIALLAMILSMAPSQYCTLWAQGGNDCKEIVRQSYARLAAEIAGEKSIALEYTVRTTMRDSARYKPTTSQIRMVAGSGTVRVVSREMEVYQDARVVVTVVRSRRSVYIANSSASELRQRRYSGFGAMRDSLLTVATVESCGDIPGSGGVRDKMVVFSLNGSAARRFKISKATIVLDRTNNVPRRFRLDYPLGSNVASVELTYTKVDLHYSEAGLSSPVLGLVLTSQGKLLPKYAGYTLVDGRTP